MDIEVELTSRERVQRVLNGELLDRVPFNFWMDRDKMAEYDENWGADFRITHYGVDVVETFVGLPWWAGLHAKTIDDGKTVWQIEPMIGSILDAVDLCRCQTRLTRTFTRTSPLSARSTRTRRSLR